MGIITLSTTKVITSITTTKKDANTAGNLIPIVPNPSSKLTNKEDFWLISKTELRVG